MSLKATLAVRVSVRLTVLPLERLGTAPAPSAMQRIPRRFAALAGSVSGSMAMPLSEDCSSWGMRLSPMNLSAPGMPQKRLMLERTVKA